MGNNIPNVNQPFNPPGGGYYEMSFKSGLITGIAAGSELFQFRFSSAPKTKINKRAELKFLKVDFIATTGFTAAQVVDFAARIARSFSANGTGGTQSLPPTLMQKKKTLYPDSEILANGDIRIATTAALGAGTETLDTFPFASVAGWAAAATAGKVLSLPLFEEFAEHHVPIIFQPNEGFVIQNLTAFGAAGVGSLYVDIGWLEVIDDGMSTLW
jgi:hypothetical protein